jgi:hypothetical protein
MAEPVSNTGPKKIDVVGGDGEASATGLVQPVTGLEQRPCMACTSFEKNDPKLVQYLRARKMTVAEDGTFETPIAKEAGYKSMRLNVKDFGWCRQGASPTDQLATCERWNLRRDMASLFGK